MKPYCRDTDGGGTVPSSVPRNELDGQDQRVEKVPAGLLVAARASGRERLGPVCHFRLEANIGRSTLEVVRSRRGDSQPFPEALRDDPYCQDSIRESVGRLTYCYSAPFLLRPLPF
jgi:hypothetical protein